MPGLRPGQTDIAGIMDHSRFSNHIKRWIVIAHDMLVTALAIFLCLLVPFSLAEMQMRLPILAWFLPAYLVVAAITYRLFGLYRSKWRFASLPDLYNIFRAVSLLTLVLVGADYALSTAHLISNFLFGKKAIFLYWVLQIFLLGGPRLALRYLKYSRVRQDTGGAMAQSVLVAGRMNEAEIVLRALESGLRRRFVARGVVSPRGDERGMAIRGVPMVGSFADLERLVHESADTESRIGAIILSPAEESTDADYEPVLAAARRLGLSLFRMQALEGGDSQSIHPLEIEDLLFRPPVEGNRANLRDFIAGKRVIVTGGGGSIGSEICQRLAAFGASELMIVENGEAALYGILEALLEAQKGRDNPTKVTSVLADIRDRARIFSLFRAYRPDLVFHAAALKQLPFLEENWSEGIRTNVFGSMNVADACVDVGAAAVMISTDKAVDPVSVLGATKRFSEIYAQMLDATHAQNQNTKPLISVRFGNVLGSVGSVVPKFKAQIAMGGPVTVTHPEMVRYFMTVRESVDLVLTAAAHAGSNLEKGAERASVYVLKMGQPTRILDLALRMIRLSGLEPGRDIAVQFSGIRKGERLNEILFASDEPIMEIGVDGVMAARTRVVDPIRMKRWIDGLEGAVEADDRSAASKIFGEAIPAFRRSGEDMDAEVVRLAHPVSRPA